MLASRAGLWGTLVAAAFWLAAYLVPVLISLAGGMLVAALLRLFTRARPLPAAGVAPDEPLGPELERQVDEELAR